MPKWIDSDQDEWVLLQTTREKGEGAMLLCPEIFRTPDDEFYSLSNQPGPRPKSVTFRVGDTLHQQLTAIATTYGLTLSDAIHRILSDAVQRMPGRFERVNLSNATPPPDNAG